MFEGTTERALGLEAQCVGYFTDGKFSGAYQIPRALKSQATGIFERGFIKYFAKDADEMGRGIVGDRRQSIEIQSRIHIASDQVLYAQQSKHGLMAPQGGATTAAIELAMQRLLSLQQQVP